ncbi:MAG: amidohydrolase family protein [Pseudomonadota bacterium]
MVVFEHADVLDAAAGALLKDRFVRVDGAIIAEVSAQPIVAAGARRIDARGKVLMPGLIDCHVHCLASLVNLGRMAQMPNVLAALRAVPLLRGMIDRGFTTVRDAGGADFSLAEATRTGLIAGPRIFPSGKGLSQTGGHGDFRERRDTLDPCACTSRIGAIARIADGIDAVRRAAREEIQKGATQIKIMASGGVASPNDPIHFLGYSEDEIRAIVEEASNADTYVMAHAYTPRAIVRAVRCGVRTIEHGNLVDADAARVMADLGAIAVPTLVTYEALAAEGATLGFPPEAVAKIEAVRVNGLRSLEIFAHAGVRMAYGSDLLGESQRLQSDEFALRARVLGAAEAVRAATLHGAHVLRMDGRLGVVAPGAVADLLLVDGNPLENVDILRGQGDRLSLIMKEGRIHKDLVQGAHHVPQAS